MKLVIDLATLKGWLQILSIVLPLIILGWLNYKTFYKDRYFDDPLFIITLTADSVLIVMIIAFVYPWIWG